MRRCRTRAGRDASSELIQTMRALGLAFTPHASVVPRAREFAQFRENQCCNDGSEWSVATIGRGTLRASSGALGVASVARLWPFGGAAGGRGGAGLETGRS